MTYRRPGILFQIASVIFTPVLIFGLLVVELIDWLMFTATPKEPAEVGLIKATLRGCFFWIAVGVIAGLIVLLT